MIFQDIEKARKQYYLSTAKARRQLAKAMWSALSHGGYYEDAVSYWGRKDAIQRLVDKAGISLSETDKARIYYLEATTVISLDKSPTTADDGSKSNEIRIFTITDLIADLAENNFDHVYRRI